MGDDTSMVIMAESSDREWYVLDEVSFAESYELPGGMDFGNGMYIGSI